MNQKNTITVSIALVLGLVAALVAMVGSHYKAEDVRIQREITERARIEACASIDDELVRANCILSTKAVD